MYPVDLTADYGDGGRSRGYAALGALFFLKALLLIPHLVVLWALSFVSLIVAWIGYWVILFTGELPESFYRIPERTQAWAVRTSGWLYGLTDAYPPFEWEPQAPHVDLQVAEGPGPRSRLFGVLGIVGLKSLALIPHIVVLFFVNIVGAVAVWIGFWAVLFTGRLPRGIFDFSLGMLRWNTRLQTWLYSLTDEYPPFALSR